MYDKDDWHHHRMTTSKTTEAHSNTDARISEILSDLANRFDTPSVTIEALSTALATRAYGMLMLVLALPNLIPIPTPGRSTIVGAPLMLVTLQMAFGRESLWLPPFIGKRSLKTAHVQHLCKRVVPVMKKLELLSSPRLQFLIGPIAVRAIALLCTLLSLMIMMPIPFGNAIPALSISCFALGILQRDGLFIIAGLMVTLLGIAAISAFISSIFHLFF
jgi:hypothetical protein